jgi:hypothetical protein
MISSSVWLGVPNSIDLPTLRSLRICDVGGTIYSGLLLGINVTMLELLVLKDV